MQPSAKEQTTTTARDETVAVIEHLLSMSTKDSTRSAATSYARTFLRFLRWSDLNDQDLARFVPRTPCWRSPQPSRTRSRRPRPWPPPAACRRRGARRRRNRARLPRPRRAALQQADSVRVASARMLTAIYCRLTSGHDALDRDACAEADPPGRVCISLQSGPDTVARGK